MSTSTILYLAPTAWATWASLLMHIAGECTVTLTVPWPPHPSAETGTSLLLSSCPNHLGGSVQLQGRPQPSPLDLRCLIQRHPVPPLSRWWTSQCPEEAISKLRGRTPISASAEKSCHYCADVDTGWGQEWSWVLLPVFAVADSDSELCLENNNFMAFSCSETVFCTLVKTLGGSWRYPMRCYPRD